MVGTEVGGGMGGGAPLIHGQSRAPIELAFPAI